MEKIKLTNFETSISVLWISRSAEVPSENRRPPSKTKCVLNQLRTTAQFPWLEYNVEKSITNSIDLIHEDNAWLMVSGIVEHLSDESGTLTNVLVNNGAGHNLINNMFYSTLWPCSITLVSNVPILNRATQAQ